MISIPSAFFFGRRSGEHHARALQPLPCLRDLTTQAASKWAVLTVIIAKLGFQLIGLRAHQPAEGHLLFGLQRRRLPLVCLSICLPIYSWNK